MGSRYLTDLAAILRAAGLDVIEEPGWETRARGSGGYDGSKPWCVMWHHTASDTSRENDVAFICHNAEDAPLANLHLSNGGTVTVCAAGATNTNGKGKSIALSKGTVPADSMNTYAIGIEAANSGVGELWSQPQIDAFFTVNDALTRAYGLLPNDCCTHAEYAPDRKIDPATAAAVEGAWKPRSINSSGTWDVSDVRQEAVLRAEDHPPNPTPTGDLMYTLFDIGGYGGETYGGYMDGHGIFGQITWLSPARAEAYLNAGADHIGKLSPADLINTDLLGPCPEGTPRETFANVIG